MSGWGIFLIAWIALGGLTVFVRGIVGSTRTYTEIEGLFAVIECGFLIWIVATRL